MMPRDDSLSNSHVIFSSLGVLCIEIVTNYTDAFTKFIHRVTAEAVAAPITKRDRVVEFGFITRGAQNVKDKNFKVS